MEDRRIWGGQYAAVDKISSANGADVRSRCRDDVQQDLVMLSFAEPDNVLQVELIWNLEADLPFLSPIVCKRMSVLLRDNLKCCLTSKSCNFFSLLRTPTLSQKRKADCSSIKLTPRWYYCWANGKQERSRIPRELRGSQSSDLKGSCLAGG